jgi:membrane fusion protein, multidrug efflux system
MRSNFLVSSKYLVIFSLFICTIQASAETSTAGATTQKTNKIAPAAKPAKPTPEMTKSESTKPESNQPKIEDVIQTTSEPTTAETVRVLLVPEKETTISSTMAARIVTFNGALGRNFKTGDILVAFDCEEAQARAEMSKAELAGAIEQHEAKVKMQGLEQASDVEVALAASASNKAKAQLNLNQAQVSQCKIYAPWSGRVAKAIVKNNMTVTPGQPLMELVNNGPLKLKLNVPSKLLARIKAGSQFSVTIDETGQTYPAVISAINSRVDPVSQTVEIEAKLTKSYRELLAGMSGTAYIAGFN